MEVDTLVSSSQSEEEVIVEQRKQRAAKSEKAIQEQLADAITKEQAYVCLNFGYPTAR